MIDWNHETREMATIAAREYPALEDYERALRGLGARVLREAIPLMRIHATEEVGCGCSVCILERRAQEIEKGE